MKNRLFSAALALLLILPITGCQLAREDSGENPDASRLIGVMITTEHLDLFDFEGYLNDNLGSLSGGEINIDGSTSKYQGRLYAELREQALTSEETGETTLNYEYVFENAISFFAARYVTDSESYIGTGSDEAISDGQSSYFYGDNEEKISLEATIYVLPEYFGKAFYINPVYQSADGSVYAMTGNGFQISGGSGEGHEYSSTLEETATVTENGESKTVSASIKISVATMFEPEKVVVLQMDKDSSVVSRSEYSPEDMPEQLITERGTEYIVLETHKDDPDGGSVIAREMYSRSDETLFSFYSRDDGICIKGWTQLVWS